MRAHHLTGIVAAGVMLLLAVAFAIAALGAIGAADPSPDQLAGRKWGLLGTVVWVDPVRWP